MGPTNAENGRDRRAEPGRKGGGAGWKRRNFLGTVGGVLGAGALAGLAGCIGSLTGGNRPTLSIGYKAKFADLQYLVMDEQGYLSDLDATIEPTNFAGTDASIVSAFSDGNLDVGFFGVTQTLKMIEKGVPAKGVAANHENGFVMVATPAFAERFEDDGAEAFREVREDRGEPLKFTTGPQGGMGNLLTTYWLFEELGLSRETVEIQTMSGIKAIRRSLLSENADGTALDEPTLTQLEEEDAAIEWLAEPESFLPELPGGIMVFRESLIEDYPELAREVTAAHVRATTLINDEPDRAADAASAAIGDSVSTETAHQAITSEASTYVSDPQAIEDGTEIFAEYMRAESMLESDVGFTDAFDRSLFEAVRG